jgi:hypothetical protein
LCLTFPDGEDSPISFRQGATIPAIAQGISPQLGDPVLSPRGRNPAATAGVHVPEATGDVDDLAAASENEIGRAGKLFNVHAEPQAKGSNYASDNQLRRCVLAFDGSHDLGSLRFRKRIAHRVPILGARYCITLASLWESGVRPFIHRESTLAIVTASYVSTESVSYQSTSSNSLPDSMRSWIC